MTLDDSLRSAFSSNSKQLDIKLSNVLKITDQSIQFIPATKTYESEASLLKSKYIFVDATQHHANNSNNETVSKIIQPNLNGFNGSLNGKKVLDNAYVSDPSMKCSGPQVPAPQFQIYPIDNIRVVWDDHLKLGTGVGLNNLGNTCFLNSVLQVLANTPPLVNYLFSEHHTKQPCPTQIGYCAICALKRHVHNLFEAAKYRTESISPQFIVQKLRCVMKSHTFGRQQDAHEFLRYFVDAMQTSSLFVFKDRKLDLFTKETSPIGRIFGGFHKNDIMCLFCRSVSTTFDPFLDISLEIKQFVNIEASLQHFTRQETLSSDNAYKCPKCNRKVAAHKSYTINVPPNVLTLQLKRFDHMGKIDKFVGFSEKLNLRPYMSQKQGPPVLFKLYGVVVHSGRSTNSGHYFSFVRNPMDQWHLMDDNRVCTVSPKSVLQTSAYVLFYIRVQLQTATVKPQPKLFAQKLPLSPLVQTALIKSNGSLFGLPKPADLVPEKPVLVPIGPKPNSIFAPLQKSPQQTPPVHHVAPLSFIPRALMPPAKKRISSSNGVPDQENGGEVSSLAAQNELRGEESDPEPSTSKIPQVEKTESSASSLSIENSDPPVDTSSIKIFTTPISVPTPQISTSEIKTPRSNNNFVNITTDCNNEHSIVKSEKSSNQLETPPVDPKPTILKSDSSIVKPAGSKANSEMSGSSSKVPSSSESNDKQESQLLKKSSKKRKRHRSRSESPDHNERHHHKSKKHFQNDEKLHHHKEHSEERKRREKTPKRHKKDKKRESDHKNYDGRKRSHDSERYRDSPERKSSKRTESKERKLASSFCKVGENRKKSTSPNRVEEKSTNQILSSKKEKQWEERRRLKKLKQMEKEKKSPKKVDVRKLEMPPKKSASPLLSPLEFLKRSIAPKVLTWETGKREESTNFPSSIMNNSKLQVYNERDDYNDEYDCGKVKNTKKSYENGENGHHLPALNIFQKRQDFKNRNKPLY